MGSAPLASVFWGLATETVIHAVLVTPDGTVFACGEGVAIADAGGDEVVGDAPTPLYAVAAVQSSDVICAGTQGEANTWNGETWQQTLIPTSGRTLRAGRGSRAPPGSWETTASWPDAKTTSGSRRR